MIAYIISAYKLPRQVVRLVHSLQSESSSFFIHVDKKATACIFDAIARELGHLPNVHLLRRHTCYWGGFGHVAATLEGIRTVVGASVPCRYVVLLTGQDYPIKSPEYIARFFQSRDGTSFINHFSLPRPEWQDGGMDRVELWHVRLRGSHFRFRFRKRELPHRMRLFGGSSYWCITRECAEYIDSYVSRNRAFVRFFKYVDVPDELFFQTLIMNSELRSTVVNDDLRFIRWNDIESGSPATLTRSDLPDLARSSKLFARKFDMTSDPEILDLIDSELLPRA